MFNFLKRKKKEEDEIGEAPAEEAPMPQGNEPPYRETTFGEFCRVHPTAATKFPGTKPDAIVRVNLNNGSYSLK
jgi:hypothetical protein